MAFRIHESVVRGEIDNRAKGMVRGKIWVEGRTEPLRLALRGNAWPDLAGCLLTFANPKKTLHDARLDSLATEQRGTIGDLTASRRVRVFDVPLEEVQAMVRRNQKPPEHWANSLYLEWFSEANGRVVIESADFELHLSAPEWRLTPAEEAERAQQAAEAMAEFMHRLTEAIEQHQRGRKDPEEEWDEHDYERFLKECDARTDKYMELLEKYGDTEDGEAKIAAEMGWSEEGTDEEAEEDSQRLEEMNAACEEALNEPEPEPDPSREGIDWVRTDWGDLAHPLQHRCFESALRFWNEVKKLGLENCEDEQLAQFLSEFQITGAKLAGALDGIARGETFAEPAFTVAYLKRALDHLHKSQAGLEAVATGKLLPESLVAEARKELFELREGVLRLMDDFRGRV